MSSRESGQFHVHVRGPLACFTRPEMKVERVSYEVMTPSAARGVLEAVLWKPAIRWRIHAIAVLQPIAWTSFRRNEIASRQTPRRGDYCADEDRAQRNTVALKDVEYVVTASFCLTERAGPEDNVRKFAEMFERRLEKGQCFHAPYLGCREFAAEVAAAPGGYQPIQPGVSRPLGRMLFDLEFEADSGAARPYFFDARLESGVMHVPSWDSVREEERVR